MDIVFIRDLTVNAVVGIYEWERQLPQEILINIEMGWDCTAAAKTENISDALDYGAVANRVREFVVQSKFQLLETLSEQTVDVIMREFSVPWVRFSCMKTQALVGVRGVGVQIERGSR